MILALDTNILSFMLQKDEKVRSFVYTAMDGGDTIVLPPIVDYEIRRGFLASRMTKRLNQYLDFLQTTSVGVFDEEVLMKATHVYAALRQQGKMIDEADILIAAFCLVNGYTLVTDNTRHFQDIDGLEIVNWKR